MDTAVVGKQPTHSLVAATDDLKTKVYVGKFWMKESQYGAFLSGELATERTYEGKVFEGYSIIEDRHLMALNMEIQALKEKVKDLESLIPKSEFTKALDNAYDKPLDEVVF